MTPNEEFWWNWGVQAVVAIATTAAVLVALFGDWLKAKCFSPRLVLKLSNRRQGVATKATLTAPDGAARSEDARYFYLTVSNSGRWPVANDVRVCLMKIEERGPDGKLQTTWAAELPVLWDIQEVNPLQRKIGPSADAALLAIIKGKWLQLFPVVQLNNLKSVFRDECHFVATFQARATEADSNFLRVQVDWDGRWQDGAEEMQKHLVIKVID
jgi:hypothetical protein